MLTVGECGSNVPAVALALRLKQLSVLSLGPLVDEAAPTVLQHQVDLAFIVVNDHIVELGDVGVVHLL